MIRLAGLGLAAILPAVTGCATEGEGSFHTLFTDPGNFSFKKAVGWEEVKTPRPPNIPQAHIEVSERVETLGQKIIGLNTFTGLEPMFWVAGVPESVLFHRGPNELIISEGLVAKCKTDAELAAVLCSELGQMVAEKRAVRRVGADRDTIPDAALPGGSTLAGGMPVDASRAAEVAYQDRRPKAAPTIAPADSAKIARDLLKGAGFDPADLDRVEPLLKQSDRGAALRKQMNSSASAPQWQK